MKLTNWPQSERPREKLIALGPSSLSDAELLAIFLGKGVAGTSVIDLARLLLSEFGSLRQLIGASKVRFCQVKGLGTVRYAQLQAMKELTRRYLREPLTRHAVLDNVSHTQRYLQSHLRDEVNEVFAVMLLDAQHRLIKFCRLFYGTINAASVHPRVILQCALEHNAAALILAHNHPSGIAEPSESDRQVTRRIVDAMELVDIRVLDHFVIGDGNTVSFAQRGWL